MAGVFDVNAGAIESDDVIAHGNAVGAADEDAVNRVADVVAGGAVGAEADVIALEGIAVAAFVVLDAVGDVAAYDVAGAGGGAADGGVSRALRDDDAGFAVAQAAVKPSEVTPM